MYGLQKLNLKMVSTDRAVWKIVIFADACRGKPISQFGHKIYLKTVDFASVGWG